MSQNRTYKFRAWDKVSKEMCFVIEIYFDKKVCFLRNQTGWDIGYRDFNEIYLMQYTGLKDKNGTPIYEGYICKQTFNGKTNQGEVIIEATRGTVVGGIPIWPHDVEVIGNIYEHPDLLK